MRLLAVALACAACATAPPPQPVHRYTKAGATQEQYMADRYACYQESAQSCVEWRWIGLGGLWHLSV
jgi:hypothetical protein